MARVRAGRRGGEGEGVWIGSDGARPTRPIQGVRGNRATDNRLAGVGICFVLLLKK